MNTLSLLTKEKLVAGIEISDSVIRVAFFRPHKKRFWKQTRSSTSTHAINKKERDEKLEELIRIEEPIAANIINDGVVIDAELLGKTIKNIWTKAKLETDYAIVAIPDDKIYSRIFSFPKSVEGAKLTEAMRLAIGFQLPTETEDMYLDWEKVNGTSSANEILLSTIPRSVVQGYIAALEFAGIKTLALESHLASIARVVEVAPGVATLFIKKTPDGATVFVLEDGILRFSRTLPAHFIQERQIPDEIKKIKNSLSVEAGKEIVEQELAQASICAKYKKDAQFSSPESKWLIALGAVIRGKIPEGGDNLISLLPVGTEEAYAYQRATTFTILVRNLIIGVSIFFIVAYSATYLFVLSLSQNAATQIITLGASAIPPELAEKEQQISNVNALTEAGVAFLAQTPLWSEILTEFSQRTPDGITISMFSAPSFTGKMSLTGVASTRTILNNYKTTLQASTLLSEVELPLTNLEQKDKIPFTISFRLIDPSALYYK